MYKYIKKKFQNISKIFQKNLSIYFKKCLNYFKKIVLIFQKKCLVRSHDKNFKKNSRLDHLVENLLRSGIKDFRNATGSRVKSIHSHTHIKYC